MHLAGTQHTDSFRVVGINYKKSDAATRGQFAINQEQYSLLQATAADYGISDFFILSTCNRTELYGFADSDTQIIDFICNVCVGDAATFANISYAQNGRSAISHLYQVAAGLDSQILGDYEILGQIKCAVKFAKANGFIGAYLERLINSVLQASKAVKTNTELSGGTVSVSFAAIQYIKEYVARSEDKDVTNRKIVLIGTGKIGRITCRNIVDYLGTHNITLINRTADTAHELAQELALQSAPFEQLGAEVCSADIILISTNAIVPILLKQHVEAYGDKLLIDISVPCNVSVDAQTLPGITFVDVDMLSKVKDDTLQKRSAEVPKAMTIIEEHIAEFMEWCDMRRHVPVLKEVKSKLLALPLDSVLHHEDRVHKVISTLATRMRKDNTPGCHYIQAINDFIA